MAEQPASLEQVIGLAMRGDARALMHLETSETEASVGEALQILQASSDSQPPHSPRQKTLEKIAVETDHLWSGVPQE